jgi:amidase
VRQVGVGVAVIEDTVRKIRPSAALPFTSVAFGAAQAIELPTLGEIDARCLEHGEKKPPHGDGIVDAAPAVFNRALAPWSAFIAITGLPAVVVPAGVTSQGLPISIEFLGRPFSGPSLLSLAHAYERSSQKRVAPKSTPHLLGEVFTYE